MTPTRPTLNISTSRNNGLTGPKQTTNQAFSPGKKLHPEGLNEPPTEPRSDRDAAIKSPPAAGHEVPEWGESERTMSLGIIKQGNKVYAYDADFDETAQKWYGEVSNRQGKTVHTTKAEFATYQDAILAVQSWIRSKLDLQ
jgi:hypothetical protein